MESRLLKNHSSDDPKTNVSRSHRIKNEFSPDHLKNIQISQIFEYVLIIARKIYLNWSRLFVFLSRKRKIKVSPEPKKCSEALIWCEARAPIIEPQHVWITIRFGLFSPSVEQFRIRVPSEVPFFLLEYLRFHLAPIQRGGSKLFKFIICLSDRIWEADPISGIISRHSISLSSLLKCINFAYLWIWVVHFYSCTDAHVQIRWPQQTFSVFYYLSFSFSQSHLKTSSLHSLIPIDLLMVFNHCMPCTVLSIQRHMYYSHRSYTSHDILEKPAL